MLTTRNDGKLSYSKRQSIRLGPGIELAQIIVENPGRLAVTIIAVELEVIGGTEKDYSVTPRLFTVPHIDTSSASGTHLRLEPYGQAVFMLDVWSVIEGERVEGAMGTMTVRARVKIAGGKHYWSAKAVTWTFCPPT